MTRTLRTHSFSTLIAGVVLAGLILAGCNKSDSGSAPPPAPGGPSGGMMPGRGPGGPGGPGGMMGGRPGGPGGMMGRGPGGRGAPLAETASGAEIYQAKCQFCHGVGGKGGRAPNLAASSKSEAELTKIIHDGKGKMPAFGSQLSDAQIKKVVAEVKGFGSGK